MNILFTRERLTCFSQARNPDLWTCRSPQPRQRDLSTLGRSSERCTNLEEREFSRCSDDIKAGFYLWCGGNSLHGLQNRCELITEKKVLLYLDKKVN